MLIKLSSYYTQALAYIIREKRMTNRRKASETFIFVPDAF